MGDDVAQRSSHWTQHLLEYMDGLIPELPSSRSGSSSGGGLGQRIPKSAAPPASPSASASSGPAPAAAPRQTGRGATSEAEAGIGWVTWTPGTWLKGVTGRRWLYTVQLAGYTFREGLVDSGGNQNLTSP